MTTKGKLEQTVVGINRQFVVSADESITLDQDTVGGTQALLTSLTCWQSFTVATTGFFKRIIWTFGNGFVAGSDYTLRIFAGEGNAGTLLFSQTNITLPALSATTRVQFDISGNLPKIAGQVYTVDLIKNNGNSQIFGFLTSTASVYAGGRSNFSALWDMRVEVYGASDNLNVSTGGTNLLTLSPNGALAIPSFGGALTLPRLTNAQISDFPASSKIVSSLIYASDRRSHQFYSTVSNAFTALNPLSVSASLVGSGNGTKTLLFGQTGFARFAKEFNFQITGGVFDTTLPYPAGASMTVNILKNGATVFTQPFTGATSTALRALTITTPVSFAPLDILVIQVVQASFAGNPDLSVTLTYQPI